MLQEPRHTGQPPLQAGAWSTRSGLRVGVADLLGWGFVRQIVVDLFQTIGKGDFFESME